MNAAYYNENDSFAAAWLRELIKAGLIADGEVDERSIELVRPDDLRGFVQCHFFAGIGGWSYALRLAGWPDDRAVWTGSCPCQPWSMAGRGEGAADPRHLWPIWSELIAQRQPSVVFGEQTASEDGRYWLDLVFVDMEARGYAVGAFDLPAASVGAPHGRSRFYFVADADGQERRADRGQSDARPDGRRHIGRHREAGGVADTGISECNGRSSEERQAGILFHASERGSPSELVNAVGSRLEGFAGHGDNGHESRRLTADAARSIGATGAVGGFWADADWLYHRDGKWRPVEPGSFPLAAGLSGRVGRIRGAGNSIVPQVAQVFIEAYCDARGI